MKNYRRQPQTTTTSSKDPSILLARGYTSRYVGGPLQTLTPDEIDKDLRHMQAYYHAVTSYQQQYYLQQTNQHNRSVIDESSLHLPPPTAATPVLLPVRIDPEEEKRLQLLRKKISKAEQQREDLEQQYVALRAHYVQVSQELQSASKQSTVDFLKRLLVQRSRVIGYLRARLQMTRDVLLCLYARASLLGDTTTSSATAATAPVPNDDELFKVWNQTEEDLKQAVQGCFSKSKKPQSWPCTQLTSTPRGVPLLVSALSTVPEKSIAMGTSGMFGSKASSLMWLETHLPNDDDDEEETTQVQQLQEEMEFLQQELALEQSQNQDLCHQIATSRSRNDEWVAMMSIVRQETEIVLHRHNVLLESEAAQMKAAEKWQEEEEERLKSEESKESEEAVEEEDKEEEQEPVTTVVTRTDDANDGDDEGSDEHEDDWDRKREAEGSGSPSNRKRQRKV